MNAREVTVALHWCLAIMNALVGAWAIWHRFYEVAALNVLSVTILAVALSAHYRTCGGRRHGS